jgi:hypothetical protein
MVASDGASFTNGMTPRMDAGQNAKVVTVSGTPTVVSVPVSGGSVRSHSSAVAFGQLLIPSTCSGAGQTQVPAAAPYGFKLCPASRC